MTFTAPLHTEYEGNEIYTLFGILHTDTCIMRQSADSG